MTWPGRLRVGHWPDLACRPDLISLRWAALGAAAAAALAALTPASAATRPAARAVAPAPPVYRYVPYVPPVDYRAPVAAEIDADRTLAESAREEVTSEHERALQLARLDALRSTLEGARGDLDGRAQWAHDLAGSLYARPVADGKADADRLDAELGPAVTGALQSIFDEASAELADVYGTALDAPRFAWPEASFQISQGFGPSDLAGEPPFAGYDHFHLGLDLAAPEGTPVSAAADGVVVLTGSPTVVGRYMGFGNYVMLAHGGQVDTLYGHLDEVLVHPGEVVHQGQTIGLEGSTGYSTGPHLHFETHLGGQPIDPAPFLPGR